MKFRALTILFTVVLLLIPAYYLLQFLKRRIRPLDSAAKMFLYFMSAFLLIIVYTIFMVGLITTIFPRK